MLQRKKAPGLRESWKRKELRVIESWKELKVIEWRKELKMIESRKRPRTMALPARNRPNRAKPFCLLRKA